MKLYGQIVSYIDGDLLSENTDLDIALTGDDQDVMTIVNGFAGQTISPKKVVANITDVVPVTGFDFDAWKAAIEGRIVEQRFLAVGSGINLTSQGFIRNPKLTAGVGKATTLAYEFHGGPGAWG